MQHHNGRGQAPLPPTSENYSYGRITRDRTEDFLRDKNLVDGLFLLRESMTKRDDYILSLCYQRGIHHYNIERQTDGTVKIENGSPFPGPVELIRHHERYQDGLIVRPMVPCTKPSNWVYWVFQGVDATDLQEILEGRAKDRGQPGPTLDDVLGPNRTFYVDQVKHTLHTTQTWYHDNIGREEADRRIGVKHEDGKFLIRSSEKSSDYRLSLSFNRIVKHYVILKKGSVTVFHYIEGGPKFESLIELVDHYYNKADGLLTPLKISCDRPKLCLPIQGDNWNPPDTPDTYHFEATDNGPDQKVYDSVPTSFNLPVSALLIQDPLGAGCFGSVMKGTYREGNRDISVAIKTLKGDDAMGTAKSEILKEARIMASLRHRHVVRLIGVCQAESIMLVLELCPLGPLNKLVKTRKDLTTSTLVRIMTQVADGMKYLEKQHFVHRDLAARNVLLVTLNFAKISDFGMSKAVGMDENYYVAQHAGKWPLKWYAPECILYYKFDSKSDVWSYGVTLWECFSNGDKPYAHMKGYEIMALINDGKRLNRPTTCPKEIYNLMLLCWTYDKHDRPSFVDVHAHIRKFEGKFDR